jgi:hypothetical protein
VRRLAQSAGLFCIIPVRLDLVFEFVCDDADLAPDELAISDRNETAFEVQGANNL